MTASTPSPRVVVVTGGAYGIGRGIVRLFVERGDFAVIADRDVKRGQALEDELGAQRALFVETNVMDENSIQHMMERVVDRWGGIDVLCNNAGIERYRRADEYTVDDWTDIVNTNLRGAFLCTKYAFPHLRARSGCVVHIASVQGLASEKNISVYAGTKAGLLGLTRSMAIDFAPLGVRVNAICPGAIETGMLEASLPRPEDREGVVSTLSANIPLARVGQPADIAGAVWFLASPDAAYVTGTSLVVDGGILAKLAL